MVAVAILAVDKGDITRLLYFVDYNGNRCGSGDLADYKYTHWTHPANQATNICVKKCPGKSVSFTLVSNNTVGSTNIGYTGPVQETGLATGTCLANCGQTGSPSSIIAAGKGKCCTFSDTPPPMGLYICVPAAVAAGAGNYAKEYIEGTS